MNKHKVAVIGGGVTGMLAAISLEKNGIHAVLLEKSPELGGHLKDWHLLFPSFTPAQEVVGELRSNLEKSGAEIMTQCEVVRFSSTEVVVSTGQSIECDAVILSSGYDLFDARIKEEYGYGIYDNVYTSYDIERMMKEGNVRTADGREPKRIAILHCVGSRDEKVCQRHCSKVCCITGVKQAIEFKKMFPQADVFNFYMDIRMFGPGYEELYHSAQKDYNVHFVRGRISEAGPLMDGRVQIKAEDTLTGRPLRMSVDMLILLVGMKSPSSYPKMAAESGLELADNGFFRPKDLFIHNTESSVPGIFIAGAASAPKSVGESLNEAEVAVERTVNFLQHGKR